MMSPKIVAVHLNYRSRAAERGRVPSNPSYFLKSPTTLSTSGADVVRPLGCELLAFEGEIGLILKDTPKNVAPEEAWGYVHEVAAANDFGVYDLRYADPGSNLHSKGWDGFTPLSETRISASSIDPSTLRVRTWVDGELVQDADSDDLIFSPEFIIADLSRVLTLNDGDVILMGTPTGSSVVRPGQTVEVEVTASKSGSSRLRNIITEGTVAIPAVGAPPRADEAAREAAFGAQASARPDTTN